ncbi:DUF697 domain-containing protein [Lacticaseibacillus mingshuiensis]|uniref:DUF697 domain-containing protein n=1 Tax=Lacticaseibacillus mingshuiensis TaxID=2799574 RepID=A0ABW4CN35_9LACO|nr:DUF697 domain-containing protein [Lacticaseibacillus mingshuiensis]
MINNQAQQAINVGKTAAGAVALSPIPFTDTAALIPICLTMLSAIYRAYDRSITDQDLKDALDGGFAGVRASLNHQGVMGFAVRQVAGNVLKLVPGIGTAAGAILNGTGAAALVDRLGQDIATALSANQIQDSFDLRFFITKSITASSH